MLRTRLSSVGRRRVRVGERFASRTAAPRVVLTATQRAVVERTTRGHVGVVGPFASGKSTAAADRVLWLDGHAHDRRVLALAATREASLIRRLDHATSFYALERRGHRVAGAMEWTQHTLEELGLRGDAQRVLSFGQLTAFLLHHAEKLPLRPFHERLATASSLQLRRNVAEMVRFFTMLEAHGVRPDAYSAYAVSRGAEIGDETHVELARAYGVYQELQQRHDVRSWHGLVLDLGHVLATDRHCLDAATREFTDVVVDDLDRMTPAMVELLAQVLRQPHLQSSLSCSHSEHASCPRLGQLHRLLDRITPEIVTLTSDGDASFSDRTGVRRVAAPVLSSPPAISSTPSTQPGLPIVTSLEFESTEDEARGVAALIKDRLSASPSSSSPRITVFCPTKADVSSVSQALRSSGIRVNGREGVDPTRRLLFDEPGVDTLFSLLVALWSPSDTKHLYNVLRSEFFSFPPHVLSRIMENQHRRASHASLTDVLTEFSEAKGHGLRAIDDATRDSAITAAEKFLAIIRECREQCHTKSVADIIQLFLNRTGHLERFLDPQTPRDARQAVALAALLREVEAAQRIVGSVHVPFVVPYLAQLQSARMVSIDGNDDAVANEPNLGIRVLPLSRFDLDEYHETLHVGEHAAAGSDLVVLMAMRDAKFPGRLKRITWPLPKELLHDPLPVQTRAEFLADAERLVYDSLVQLNPREVVVSYAKTVGGGFSKKSDKLSRVLEPLWTPPVSPPPPVHMDPSSPSSSPLTLSSTERPSPPAPAHASTSASPVFEPSHLSYSQIAEYTRCPHQYYLSRVLGLRSLSEFDENDGDLPNLAMMFGSAVHEAIAAFGLAIQRGDPLDRAEETAVQMLVTAWRTDGFLSKRQEAFFFERAQSTLRGFLRRHDPTAQIVAVEHDFECRLGRDSDVVLRGVWDRVDRTRDGAVVIREFKTNPSAQRRANLDAAAAESLQLQIYMVAYEQLHGEAPDGATLEVLEEDDAANAVGFVPYARALRARVDAVVDTTIAAIRKGEFDATPGFLQCAMCPYASSVCRANVVDPEQEVVV